jgi:ClpP class serine protease
VPTWNEVLAEVHGTEPKGTASAYDIVRRKYLAAVAAETGRPTIVYATAWQDTTSPKASSDVSIHGGDKDGFFEITRGLPDGPLDVILHSPGGSAEATEAIVTLLRSRFTDIRFIVPNAAKSAATMLALSGAQVVMGAASELGPIDPQRRWVRRIGSTTEPVTAPVWAIEQEWRLIDAEITADPSKVNKWYPIISQFGPSLLIECQTAASLAKTLVQQWLESGMFSSESDPAAAATPIVDALADHGRWLSHGRIVSTDDAIALGIKVIDLRDAVHAGLADAIWTAWHAIDLTLENTGAIKLFENSSGQCRLSQMQVIEARQAQAVPAANPTGGASPQPGRAQRRAAEREQRKKKR